MKEIIRRINWIVVGCSITFGLVNFIDFIWPLVGSAGQVLWVFDTIYDYQMFSLRVIKMALAGFIFMEILSDIPFICKWLTQKPWLVLKYSCLFHAGWWYMIFYIISI